MGNGIGKRAYNFLFKDARTLNPDPWEAARTQRARGEAAAKIPDLAKRREYIARQGKVEQFGGTSFAPAIRRLFLQHGRAPKKVMKRTSRR